MHLLFALSFHVYVIVFSELRPYQCKISLPFVWVNSHDGTSESVSGAASECPEGPSHQFGKRGKSPCAVSQKTLLRILSQ